MLRATDINSVVRFDLSRTILGRGRYWTTAYYLDGMLIDTGCAHSAANLADVLQEKPLNRIVNTHSHEDHIGANGLLQQHAGIKISAHPLALPVLADPRAQQPLQPYRRLFWGWPAPSYGRPLMDQETIETDSFCLQVIYTPGHSPDHICLFESDRGWLFTGDLFVGGKDRALRAGYEIWEIIASLKLVAKLPVRMMFPGSARVRENPKTALNRKISYLEDLGERVLALHQQGWDESAITNKLLGKPMQVEIITLGHFSRRNLVRSFLRRERG